MNTNTALKTVQKHIKLSNRDALKYYTEACLNWKRGNDVAALSYAAVALSALVGKSHADYVAVTNAYIAAKTA